MTDPIRELKIRAEILHHGLDRRDPPTLLRLRALAEYRNAPETALAVAARDIRRKHCLAVVAKEAGFYSWEHVTALMDGDEPASDFGEALYPRRMSAHLNHWFASYEEARDFRTASGGYLLAHKVHFFVVMRDYVGDLGWNPDDEDWALIGWDWARPRDHAARRRLYGKLLSPSPARP